VLYIVATNGSESAEGKIFAEAMRRFCRSIELCDDYLRGYYGLKMVRYSSPKCSNIDINGGWQTSDRMLSALPEDGKPTGQLASSDNGELPLPSTATVRELNEQATSKLAQITRRTTEYGHNYAEIVAAKDLLDRSTQTRQR
jgi:hypothetical protein